MFYFSFLIQWHFSFWNPVLSLSQAFPLLINYFWGVSICFSGLWRKCRGCFLYPFSSTTVSPINSKTLAHLLTFRFTLLLNSSKSRHLSSVLSHSKVSYHEIKFIMTPSPSKSFTACFFDQGHHSAGQISAAITDSPCLCTWLTDYFFPYKKATSHSLSFQITWKIIWHGDFRWHQNFKRMKGSSPKNQMFFHVN